jgi:hypothetical protein
MKFHKLQWLVVYTMLAIILSSCNLGATPVPTQDIGAIQTEAYNQVLTQVASASSPTPMSTNTIVPTATLSAPATFIVVGGSTPIPFNTPLPGLGLTPLVISSPVPTLPAGMLPTKNGCNDGVFVSESAPFDGDVLEPSHKFEKSFTMLNTGTCTWDEGYVFAFMPTYSTPGFFSAYDIKITKEENFIKPGVQILFKFGLTASHKPGTWIGAWKMKDDAGNYFGSMVHVKYVIGTKTEQEATAESDSLTATAEAK